MDINTSNLPNNFVALGYILPSELADSENGEYQSIHYLPALYKEQYLRVIENLDIGILTSENLSEHVIEMRTFYDDIKNETDDLSSTQVELTYIAEYGGEIIGTAHQLIPYNTDGTAISAIASDSDYSFIKWSDGITTASRVDTSVTMSKTLVAQFLKN